MDHSCQRKSEAEVEEEETEEEAEKRKKRQKLKQRKIKVGEAEAKEEEEIGAEEAKFFSFFYFKRIEVGWSSAKRSGALGKIEMVKWSEAVQK